MKRFVLLAGMVLICAGAFAEDSKWKYKGMVSANLGATSVSSNWSGAEKNSGSWGVKLDASAERDASDNNWMNTLKEEYGRTKTAGSREQTSADIFYFTSVYTRKLSHYVNPYVSFVTDTQNNRFLDPVKLTESAGNGLFITNTKTQQLKTRVGFAVKQLFDSVGNSADDPNTLKIEERKDSAGGEWITNYELLIKNDVKFTTETNVFTAFDGGANLRWDNNLYVKLSSIVTMQANYLFNYTFNKNTHPVWPNDAETRFTVGLGVSYNLF